MGAIFCAHPVAAETLQEALSNAYLINPVLNSERARLRATDEQVAVAKSGLRPNITALADAAFQNTETDMVGGSRQQVQQKVQQCDEATQLTEPAFCASLNGSQRRFHLVDPLFGLVQVEVHTTLRRHNCLRHDEAEGVQGIHNCK
jgi:hypothetical protein